MIQTDIEYLDGEIEVPENEESTLPELLALLGSEAAIIDEVTSNLRYRNKYPRVYKKASKELESEFPRAVKDEKKQKDGTIKKVLVSETDHLRAVFKQDPERVRAVVTKYAQSEPLYVKGERTGGGGKISQQALEAANGFFAEGDDVVERNIGIIEATVPSYKVARDGDGNPTPESVARGIMALNKHLLKQAQQATKAMFARNA